MNTENNTDKSRDLLSIFIVFLRLGLTAFGGPVAHLGYFREAFVARKKWLSDNDYADLVALCQFLPGPSSSQVGLSIGYLRGGYGGALMAWLGFTLPSALIMILFALSLSGQAHLPDGVLHGFKIAAVAVVAQAIWGMASSLCPDKTRRTLAVFVATFMLLLPNAWLQIGLILFSAFIGIAFCQSTDNEKVATDTTKNLWKKNNSQRAGIVNLALFFAILMGLPLLLAVFSNDFLTIFNAYFQSGSMVFGGGHVVLPLLQTEVVSTGWVSPEHFMAGYGAVQAVPGPLFTFSAFLGTASTQSINGFFGGILSTVAIFLPSFLLIFGVLPFWQKLSQIQRIRNALTGINAGVVGLLVAAFYHPVWTSAIFKPSDFALAIVIFAGLMWWRLPSWLAVIICASLGYFLSLT